jgi:oxalate decarboxylase/phosphoglucose isomerase-like protein (cupin superfamily)
MSNLIKTLIIALAATAAATPVWEFAEKAPEMSASSSSSSSMPMPTTMMTSTKPPTMTSSSQSQSSPSSSSSSAAPAATVDAAKVLALAETLRTKVTAVDRMKTLFLNADGTQKTGADLKQQTTFDFNAAKPAAGELGGRKAAAAVSNFPFLTGMGLSTTVAFLGPCGMNTPHVHPRGNEFLTVVDGSVTFGMILENGIANEISGTLNKFQATVFPQGSIHYQFNPTCAPATFVATLNNEDAGTNQVAQGFFGLNGDVVAAATGFQSPVNGQDINAFRSKIPLSLAKGIESCLKTCNIPKN